MPGIWAAVKATTCVSGSFRNRTLKSWKSRPPAPMMTMFRTRQLLSIASVPVWNGNPGRHIRTLRNRAAQKPQIESARGDVREPSVGDVQQVFAPKTERDVVHAGLDQHVLALCEPDVDHDLLTRRPSERRHRSELEFGIEAGELRLGHELDPGRIDGLRQPAEVDPRRGRDDCADPRTRAGAADHRLRHRLRERAERHRLVARRLRSPVRKHLEGDAGALEDLYQLGRSLLHGPPLGVPEGDAFARIQERLVPVLPPHAIVRPVVGVEHFHDLAQTARFADAPTTTPRASITFIAASSRFSISL